MTEFLSVENLSKHYGQLPAVDGVSLALERGRILALLGPSGSGKTTTLRLLAGFETPEAGRIVVDGEDVTRFTPVERRFGMVFQHYALFPHLNVGENVAFGLEAQGVAGVELGRRVTASLDLVDLGGFERRRVAELSGGQQQRVALARALAPEPRVLLLDEPLSNLDPTLRERTRRELRQVIHRIGITTVLVTHEQEEAFDLGDQVAVMQRGRVEQAGTPDALYRGPMNAFVAEFVGRSSWLPGILLPAATSGMRVRMGAVEWRLSGGGDRGGWPGAGAGGEVLVMVRPEALRFVTPSPEVLTGEVLHRRFAGATAFFTVAIAGGTSLEISAAPAAARVGDTVGLAPLADPVDRDGTIHLFPAGAR